MAYVAETRDGSDSPWKVTLCLTPEESQLLLPAFEKRLKQAVKMYEKYKDIQEGGEATERQQDLLVKYGTELDHISSAVFAARDIVKTHGKKPI